MTEKSSFYTLKGYDLQKNSNITNAMEDYIEMIYRHTKAETEIHMKELAQYLNVSLPSASKMVARLNKAGFLHFERYGTIRLSEAGKQQGEYFLWRHNVLTSFFQILNQSDYHLEQVEKIEHFVDLVTLKNLEKWMKQSF